jgi:hypothetical protein
VTGLDRLRACRCRAALFGAALLLALGVDGAAASSTCEGIDSADVAANLAILGQNLGTLDETARPDRWAYPVGVHFVNLSWLDETAAADFLRDVSDDVLVRLRPSLHEASNLVVVRMDIFSGPPEPERQALVAKLAPFFMTGLLAERVGIAWEEAERRARDMLLEVVRRSQADRTRRIIHARMLDSKARTMLKVLFVHDDGRVNVSDEEGGRTLRRMLLVGLGLPPFVAFRGSLFSATPVASEADAAIVDTAVLRVLAAAPWPQEWRAGLSALRTFCARPGAPGTAPVPPAAGLAARPVPTAPVPAAWAPRGTLPSSGSPSRPLPPAHPVRTIPYKPDGTPKRELR